jgi:carotenoid cleavage dioxygenase-like enzyme
VGQLTSGPNPLYATGLVHAVRLDGRCQRANYSATFVRTAKLRQEVRAGRALFRKFGDLKGPLGLVGHRLGPLRMHIER